MRNRCLGCAMIVAALMMLGSSFVAAKAIIETVPTFLALSLRLALASLVLLPMLAKCEPCLPRLDKQGWGLLILQGLIGVVLFNVFLFSGLERTTAGCAGIAFGMLPIFVGVFAWFLLRERMTGTKAVAIVFAAVGTIQLNVENFEVSLRSVAMLGNVLVLAAVCCEGMFTILGKQLTNRCTPLASAALVSVVSLAMVAPFAVRDAMAFDFAHVSLEDWLTLSWWALASGVGYFFLFYAGLRRVEATTAGISTVALPATTLLLSHWLLREPIEASHMIGLACAVSGILLLFAPKPRVPWMPLRSKDPVPEINPVRLG